MRAVPKKCLKNFVRALTAEELAELDLATRRSDVLSQLLARNSQFFLTHFEN